jgi:hypothetical protein
MAAKRLLPSLPAVTMAERLVERKAHVVPSGQNQNDPA